MGGLAVRRREKLKFVDRCSRGPHNRTYNATRHFTLWKGQDQLRNSQHSFSRSPAKSDDDVYQKGGDAS